MHTDLQYLCVGEGESCGLYPRPCLILSALIAALMKTVHVYSYSHLQDGPSTEEGSGSEAMAEEDGRTQRNASKKGGKKGAKKASKKGAKKASKKAKGAQPEPEDSDPDGPPPMDANGAGPSQRPKRPSQRPDRYDQSRN